MVMQNMCYIQYVNNIHANKQLVNSENWSLYLIFLFARTAQSPNYWILISALFIYMHIFSHFCTNFWHAWKQSEVLCMRLQVQRIKPCVVPPTSASSIFSFQINHFRKKDLRSVPPSSPNYLASGPENGWTSVWTRYYFFYRVFHSHLAWIQRRSCKRCAGYRASILSFLRRVSFSAMHEMTCLCVGWSRTHGEDMGGLNLIKKY